MTSIADAPAIDRREHERKRTLRSYAELLFDDHAPVIVRTINVSEGGAAVVADNNPAIGMILRLRLSVPVREGGPQKFTLLTRVINCIYSADEGGFRLGLQFLDLPPGMDNALRAFIMSGVKAEMPLA